MHFPPNIWAWMVLSNIIAFAIVAVAIPIEESANKLEVNINTLESRAAPDNFWLTQMTHGSSPYAPAGYPIFRNVKDYGAKGDGVTDDTDAINAAASAGGRCEGDCGSTSVLGAVVYFPSGTYKISKPIFQHYYTQFIGNPNDRPILKATADFKGIALIDSDFYIPGADSAQWYINQSNFFRQIRNLILDITAMPPTIRDGDKSWPPTALHWQVAQATSLYNLHFIMSTASNNNQTGIFMENGSGGFISDLTFYGGQFGMRCGAQQFTARDLHFTSCITAIQMIWDWTWTWKNIHIYSCWVGIDVTGDGSANGQPIGSITVMDSSFTKVPIAILTSGQTNINIDNVEITDCNIVVGKPGGPTILAGGNRVIKSWVTGRVYDSYASKGTTFTGVPKYVPVKPAGLLDSLGGFFIRKKPQYETLSASSFYNVKNAGAQGNGQNDDTNAINSALKSGKIVFFPAGVYKVTGQIFIPVGSRIVGESWSQIMGSGSYFGDASNPKVMVKVGNPGDSGVIEIQDMIFTTSGPTPGAIIMEWNVKQSFQGSAAMWDSHIRIGGAVGTNLQAANCPKLTGEVNENCMAATMLLHLTKKSSAYLENVWAWVADHDLDIPAQAQVDVFVARGVLIESTAPTWLWGTASEHSTLYQYQLAGSSNVFMGLVQTESPYYQSKPVAPFPWDISRDEITQFAQDPAFNDCIGTDDREKCAVSWAIRILDSSDIYLYGVGFYSWFQNYDQACVALENCQTRLIQTSFSEKIYMYGIATKGAQEVVSPGGDTLVPALQKDNQNGYTANVAAWLPLAEPGSAALGKKRLPFSDWIYSPNQASKLDVFHTWSAFGDSYSAGPGAGRYVSLFKYKSRADDKLKDCMIYDRSYPYLLANEKSPAQTSALVSRTFGMHSCTGARNEKPPLAEGDPVIMEEELRNLQGTEDFITLSIGGNDMGFSGLADACVFGFSVNLHSSARCQNLKQKAGHDLAPGGRIYQLLVKTYGDIIDKYYLLNRTERKRHFTIFITRYLSLFRVDPPPGRPESNCNRVNFKYQPFLYSPIAGLSSYNILSNPHVLDRAERQYWATLVDTLNQRIDDAVRTVDGWGSMYKNRLVIVTSTADLFTNHRFCESGVNEPDYLRDDTWFYLPALWSGLLPGAKKTKREHMVALLERQIPSRPEDNPDHIKDVHVPDNVDEERLLKAGDDWLQQGFKMRDVVEEVSARNPSIPKRTLYDNIARMVVGLVRTAHPTVDGFRATKWALCEYICNRFPLVENCPPNRDNCP